MRASGSRFRYWSITDIYYVQNRTPRRIFFMLLVIWVLSLLISLAPIFGWKDAQFVTRVHEEHVCLISQQISYQVFSTATAFYIPLCAIIVVYYKIMRAAKKRFRRDRDRRTVHRSLDPKTKLRRSSSDDDQVRIIVSAGRASEPLAGLAARRRHRGARPELRRGREAGQRTAEAEGERPRLPHSSACLADRRRDRQQFGRGG